MAFAKKEDQLAYQRKWRKEQKDGKIHVYYIPEEHYVGISVYPKGRMCDHSKNGRITDNWEIIASFERGVDAHWFETLLHMRGYNGYNYGSI